MKNETKLLWFVGGFLILAVAVLLFSLNEDLPSPVIIADNNLRTFNSIEEIQEFVQESSVSELGRTLESARATIGAQSTTGAPVVDAAQSAEDFSQTNIQVEGVDEPDIVKNDGKYIYTITGNKVVIVDAFPADDMSIVSEIELDQNINNLFLNGDKLIVFSNSYGYFEAGFPCFDGGGVGIRAPCGGYSKSLTNVNMYDISDRKNPELKDEIEVDGWYVDSRMIDEHVYFISSQNVQLNYFELPAYRVNGILTEARADDIAYFDRPDSSYTFNSIVSIDLRDGEINREIYLMGSSRTIFVSQNNIYLTNMKQIRLKDYLERYADEVAYPILPSYEDEKIKEVLYSDYLSDYEKQTKMRQRTLNYLSGIQLDEGATEKLTAFMDAEVDFAREIQIETEKTVVHRIEINSGRISYVATGEVSGRVLNQFSMDEYKDYLRIATTIGHVSRSGEATSSNNLYILDNDLEIVGSVEDLAPGERIYSARFLGNKAYIVTFKKVDPLFVIDVSNPRNPEALGYLKITGYSDYLHPYDENHIIGIGKETVEAQSGDFAWYQGVKISLFDVSDFENPKEVAKVEIGDRGTDSYALYDHKAFLFDRGRNLLVVPIGLSKIDKSKYSGEILDNAFGEKIWQGAFVLSIDLDGISERGRITHYDAVDEFNDWYYRGGRAIKRSLYMDDVLYTISQSKIKANDLKTIEELNEVELPYDFEDYPIAIY